MFDQENLLSSSSLVPMPPVLLFSRVCTRSDVTAEAKFKQKMKNKRMKFIMTANTNEKVLFEMLERKSNILWMKTNALEP